MTSIRVKPDDGPPVDILAAGSRILDDETPRDILPVVITRLRRLNKDAPAREISLAITHAEESLHWLKALDERTAPVVEEHRP